jgi:hypothetical protein
VRSYYDKARTAVRDIVDSSPVPISKSEKPIEAFSQAVKDTKIKLHQQYSQMAVDAGEKGALVDLQPVIDDMKAVYVNANVQRAGGGMPEMLEKKIAEWDKLPKMVDPVEAEELIAMLNQQAKPYWKDPTSHTTAAGLERIAQQTRKQAFDAINSYEGPGYSDLRKRYGAQLALEKEVADRATVAGRRAEFGFFDLANIPVAAEFVTALSGNPASIAKAGGMWGVKKIMQKMNDPETIVRKMFKDVETLNAIKARYAPKPGPDISGSRPTPLALPMPERGFTMQGGPYGPEILRPVKAPAGAMEAEFTSYPRGLLDMPRRDPVLQLPAGGQFVIPDEVVPWTSNAKMKQKYESGMMGNLENYLNR